MLAAHIEKEGSLDFIKVTNDSPKPILQPGQALILVKAAGVNKSDIAGTLGYLKSISKVPRILGRDFTGVVEETIGSQEDQRWINVEVWGTDGNRGLTQDGTFAEYMTVPISSLVRKPSTVPSDIAASLPLPWLCAYIAVYSLAEIKESDRVLVIGAGGAIGSAVSQMLRGKRVKSIYGTSRQRQQLQPGVKTISLDSNDASDYGLVRKVKESAGNTTLPDYLDVIIDCTGRETLVNAALSLLSAKGKARLIMMATSDPSGRFTIDMRSLYMKSVTLKGLSSNVLEESQLIEALETITKGFEDGSYKVKYCSQVDQVALSSGSEILISALKKASSGRRIVLTL